MSARCPVCGDPKAFPLWIDDEPPDCCPIEMSEGIRIRVVTDCPYQMGKAKREATWRKLFPNQFDETGKIKPGGLAHIMTNWPKDQPWLP